MRLLLALAAAAVLAAPVAASGAAPVAAAPRQAPVMVYFEVDSDQFSAVARAILDEVVTQYRKGGSVQIVLAGHADPQEGASAYAVGLSQRRANNVRDYLAAQGVPPGVMTTQAFGQSRPAVQTPHLDAANRRVEITFGPGSGW